MNFFASSCAEIATYYYSPSLALFSSPLWGEGRVRGKRPLYPLNLTFSPKGGEKGCCEKVPNSSCIRYYKLQSDLISFNFFQIKSFQPFCIRAIE